MTDTWVVLHRSRPLVCLAGLHVPAWVWDRGRPFSLEDRLCVCARCGVLLTGDTWRQQAGNARVRLRAPLLALALGTAAGVLLTRPHRARR